MIKTLLVIAILLLLSMPAFAGESHPSRLSSLQPEQASMAPAPSGRPGSVQEKRDEQLERLTAEFTGFAREKVGEMNRNLVSSRERMEIRKEKDGTYRAIYHQIDDASLASEVSRSRSKTIPYVAVLTYREEIYAASGSTPAQCRQGPFSVVGYIPNRHIFSYSNGSWN